MDEQKKTDLVTRLRDLDARTANPPHWTTGICGEAADRIERALNEARSERNKVGELENILDEWMKMLGAGVFGHQAESTMIVHHALQELLILRKAVDSFKPRRQVLNEVLTQAETMSGYELIRWLRQEVSHD